MTSPHVSPSSPSRSASLMATIQNLSNQLNATRSDLQNLRYQLDHDDRYSLYGGTYDRYSMVDYVQDQEIDAIQNEIKLLARHIRDQQQRLLRIMNSLRASNPRPTRPTNPTNPYPATPSPPPPNPTGPNSTGSNPTGPNPTGPVFPAVGDGDTSGRNWVAVEDLKPPVLSHAVPFYVTGEVEAQVGADDPALRIAKYQGRDPNVLVLDLIEDSSSSWWNRGTRFTPVRFSRKISQGEYKRVQINRDGNRLALIDVQAANGTKQPSKPTLSSGEDLQQGSSGERVRVMQQILASIGYQIFVDGDFGPETDKVVRDFQDNEEIKVDGVVGPITRRHLNQVDQWWRPKKQGKSSNGWRSLFN